VIILDLSVIISEHVQLIRDDGL